MKILSIVIPIYNIEKYLAKCLDSILVDNNFTGQVVCVNDGSTDGSLNVLERYAAKYPNIEIISQTNAGLSEARNVGLRAAKGDYVMFIDSDDWLSPNTLEKLIGHVDGEDVLYFNGRKFFEDKKEYQDAYPLIELIHVDGQRFFAEVIHTYRNIPWVCVVGGIYKRSYLMDNNLRNEPGIYHEDSYFTPQVLLCAKDVSCVDINVYVYRIREGSITDVVKHKHIADALWINRNLYEIFTKRGGVDEAFYTYLTKMYITVILEACSNRVDLRKLWSDEDSKIMGKGVFDERSRKIAKLACISPRLAYLYCENKLPEIVRRVINRFV